MAGSWSRLFDPARERERAFSRSQPLWYSLATARIETWLSWALVVAALSRAVRHARTRAEEDQAFGLAVVTMLLVSPFAREHSFLPRLGPLAVFGPGLPKALWMRTCFPAIRCRPRVEPWPGLHCLRHRRPG
jgi:hypothetical protein